MFDLIMWLIVMGIPFVVTIYWSISEYLNSKKKLSLIIFIASLIPLINWVTTLTFLIATVLDSDDVETIIDKQKRFNKTRNCGTCGINSKYGRTLVHRQFNGKIELCPFCESSSITRTYGDEQSPLSKRFGLIETFSLQNKINKYFQLKEEEDEMLFKDSQLQKYQKIQEEKLAKMMKERGY